MLVVPKSFSFSQFIYPSEARNQVAFSCGRRGTTVVVDEELDCAKDTSSVSLRLPPSLPQAMLKPNWGRLRLSDCHVCGGRATIASGGFFDEPIGSACEMPQGGLCKPPARLVVMTFFT